jgi:ElaB/YqjD/DUF883 family membrane-anchored ribosome-binding protein
MSNMGSMTRDMTKEAKDAVRETGSAAAAGKNDIRDDLAALRDDVARLGAQIADILASRGNAAWQKARSNMEDVLSDAQSKGAEAVGAVREVGDTFGEAIDESLKRRPYTTLALAAAIGFIFGAAWRR